MISPQREISKPLSQLSQTVIHEDKDEIEEQGKLLSDKINLSKIRAWVGFQNQFMVLQWKDRTTICTKIRTLKGEKGQYQ